MSKPGCEYYWFLHGCRPEPSKEIIGYNPEREAYRKSIGNYFETEEEAKKAVEKLKAWKRLKDKGFEFVGYRYGGSAVPLIEFTYESGAEKQDQFKKDIDLLFGGKE